MTQRKAIQEGTKIGLKSAAYQVEMIRILEQRLADAVKTDDTEGIYAFAAGIEAIRSYGNCTQR